MPDPRIAGRKGSTIRLNALFYKNGVLADPYAVRRIDIYKGSKATENLVIQVPVIDPTDVSYPSPIGRDEDSVGPIPGRFFYDLLIPDDFTVPSIYIDEWLFIGDEMVGSGGSAIDLDDETLWDSQCNRFWAYPSNDWYIDDGLISARFGFEPLDRHFIKTEIKPLEVGIMPLPLYDFDYNRVAPLIPRLVATIDIETLNNEIIYEALPCTIAIRQGSYRTNPFVVRYVLDTNALLMGTYRYRITLHMPNGETRVSPSLVFTVG